MSEKSLYISSNTEESYWSLFWTFLKIGSTAFGGFMALISVVQNYVVDRKKLLAHEEMLDGISLATILPGPIAVNVVAYVGYKIRGLWGAFICAFAVTLPAFLLLLALSYMYFTYGEIPAISNIFGGFLPAVAAIIVVAAFNMGKKALTTPIEMTIAIVAMLSLILIGGFYVTLGVIVISGVIGYLILPHEQKKPAKENEKKALIPPALIGVGLGYLFIVGVSAIKANATILASLFATFSAMGVFLFGGGFVFIPLMQEIVVDTYHWITHKEFIDGIALGQVTPGPIVISATFIGYKVAGISGATLATIGIFATPAILMLVCTTMLDRIKHSVSIKAIMKGIRCGVIGMIAAAAFIVIRTAEPNLVTLMIFILSLSSLLILKLEVVWIIPMAGLLGYLMY